MKSKSEFLSDTYMKKPSHPFVDLLISIVLPSVILMKFSGENALGSVGGLLAALSLPLLWGLFELVRYKKRNWVAVLGLASVLLTGGIGLLKLDTQWLAVKEAAIPAIIGIGVYISAYTKKPLMKVLMLNPHVFDVDKMMSALASKGMSNTFEKRLSLATVFLSGTFFFSSVMNYVLAKWIVTSSAGSPAFNEELGRLTLMSYPMIVIPSMIMMAGIIWYLMRAIHTLCGLSFEDVLLHAGKDGSCD